MPEHPLLSVVRLVTDRFEGEGAKYRMIGTVVEIYENDEFGRGFKIAFTDPKTGHDFSMVTCKSHEIELVNDHEAS